MRSPTLACAVLLLTAIPLCSPSAAAAAAAGAPTAAYTPRRLTAAEAGADVALMRRALETVHPGLTRYRSRRDIDAAFARLEAAAATPTTDLDLHRAISLMLAEIRCDHTKAEMSEALDAWRRSHATHLPLRFRMIEGRMIVVSNDGQASAPPPGSEILAINGRPVTEVLATLAKAVDYDGLTVPAIDEKLAADSDLMGDDFNEYYPSFFGFPSDWSLEWKRPGVPGSTRVVLAPITFAAWTRLEWPAEAYRAEFYKAVGWRVAGKAAYLRIDTFVNYRNPVDATAFLGGFFRTLKARGTEQLILDLRNNAGGSEDVSVALGRYLLPAPFTWSRPVRLKAIRYGDLPRHIESWSDPRDLFEPPVDRFVRTADGWYDRIPDPADPDQESGVEQQLSPDRFAGRLTLLTSPANASGATRTAAQLKEKLGARIVGEDTAGSAEGPTAGHIFLLTLPNSGLKVRVPNAWNRTNLEHFTPGLGVAADEVVTPTLADFEAGRDRALEVAKAAGAGPLDDTTRTTLLAQLSGRWRGVLEYRDYGSDARVVLATELDARSSGPVLNLAYAHDEGDGRVVRTVSTWRAGPAGVSIASATGRPVDCRLRELRGDAAKADLTLACDSDGEENGSAVVRRLVLTLRGRTLSISEASRTPGGPMLLRNAYRLERVD